MQKLKIAIFVSTLLLLPFVTKTDGITMRVQRTKDGKSFIDYNKLLRESVWEQDIRKANFSLLAGANINHSIPNVLPPLFVAIINLHIEMLLFLLKNGARTSITGGTNGLNSIDFAKYHLEEEKILLQKYESQAKAIDHETKNSKASDLDYIFDLDSIAKDGAQTNLERKITSIKNIIQSLNQIIKILEEHAAKQGKAQAAGIGDKVDEPAE